MNVSQAGRKPLIGIIGGIASGKSTVAAEFAKLGCAVIDADAIAHQALDTDAVRDAVVAQFGRAVLDDSERIDRRKVAQMVFADRERLTTLNGIIHPYVFAQTEERITRYARDETVEAIVLDMPLLVEVGWADRCDRIVFVDCDREQRLARARQTRGLSAAEIKIRENFQISLDKKISLADNTVDSNSDFSTLVRQINDIFSDITKNG